MTRKQEEIIAVGTKSWRPCRRRRRKEEPRIAPGFWPQSLVFFSLFLLPFANGPSKSPALSFRLFFHGANKRSAILASSSIVVTRPPKKA
ncbi:hypothetical protein [Pandoravirus japonicus]|uniref:Uncharacterized protein n=1 Tax=Pandoravirus japonicus TaxID=2823154 RepID=A0A811BP10_9VIRU|nr:hypothetical protein [Pandoravirus japonicus]